MASPPDTGADDTDDTDDDREPLRSDPETGSTKPDPAVEGTGPPPEGDDPMAGEAPSS